MGAREVLTPSLLIFSGPDGRLGAKTDSLPRNRRNVRWLAGRRWKALRQFHISQMGSTVRDHSIFLFILSNCNPSIHQTTPFAGTLHLPGRQGFRHAASNQHKGRLGIFWVVGGGFRGFSHQTLSAVHDNWAMSGMIDEASNASGCAYLWLQHKFQLRVVQILFHFLSISVIFRKTRYFSF